jgi:tetratricopeptide (TPR) repeat protein
MRTRSFTWLVLLPLFLASAALAADPAAFVAAKRELQASVSHGQSAEMLKARVTLATLAAAEPKSPALAYWLALADWRLVPVLTSVDKEQAKKLCNEGLAACDRALAVQPRFAEAIALRAGLQGLWLGFVPADAMTLGPEMEEAFGRASGIEPGNPRVVFLKALGTLHKPSFVGGGAEKAKPQFERAIELFKSENPADSTAIDWGRDDALLWSGQCLAKLGDLPGAVARYREALALNPANAWTNYVLLPAAEKELAAKSSK